MQYMHHIIVKIHQTITVFIVFKLRR